jgi:microcin C transport system permease protein
MTLAIMLSLLVFIGEGLRDAFDPRHVKQRPISVQENSAQETPHV